VISCSERNDRVNDIRTTYASSTKHGPVKQSIMKKLCCRSMCSIPDSTGQIHMVFGIVHLIKICQANFIILKNISDNKEIYDSDVQCVHKVPSGF
jgi:hypothetical protein